MSWADEDTPEPERQFDNVDAFVTGFLAPTYRRSFDSGARVWCPSWHEHPEAVSRLAGLWLAWETLSRDDSTGLSTWWLHHCDPTMAVLLDGDGPFKRCHKGHTDQLKPLPCEELTARATS